MVRFDAAKGFVPEQKTDLAKQLKAAIAGAPAQAGKAAATLSFTIVADAPFFISDPSSGEINASVQLAALEDSAGRPVIWPSSLMGVLRSRAAWLAEIERLRAKDAAVYTPKKRNPDHPADDRDLAHIFGSRRAVERKSDVASLSSVERLFGVAGWKGLINVASLTLDPSAQGQPVKLTSVKIDRLSGGVIDGALFTTRAFAGARFNVRLIVNCSGRGWIEAERLKQDLGLLRALGEDLEKRGLEIGHASARGFGWCGVENVQFEEAPQ
jgi:CRISPR/Cas system CSM-associated protein Csm3 (group 7 of RAMP superfamily)